MSAYVLCYTRMPDEAKLYDPKLAYSMHLAISEEGKPFMPLNHNSGVLFAKATENKDGSLNAKSIQKPYLFRLKNGDFGIVAIRTEGEGGYDTESKGGVIFFTSKDLITYEEVGVLVLEKQHGICEVVCHYEEDAYSICWKDEQDKWYVARIADLDLSKRITSYEKADDNVQKQLKTWLEASSQSLVEIEGIVPGNCLEVSHEVVKRLVDKLQVPENTGVYFPQQVSASSEEALYNMRAQVTYSDGTKDYKRVDWNLSEVDWTRSGTYEIQGRIHQDHYEFPIAFNRADPCIAKWGEKYYFIATNDADGNHSLYIREADNIPDLVNAKETLLLDSNTYEGIGGLLWAPEFHEIEGRLYIFHGATPGEFYYEESHIMALREGGNPSCRADWSRPKRVVKPDGSYLCEAGKEITLDMTCFYWEGEYYAIWSQRQFLPKDLGAWLYIAKVNRQMPWRLATEPVILSKPEYGWANNHTFVDEGPFALIRGDKLFVTFSSAAIDYSYVVGLLSIDSGLDLLDKGNWKKGNYPILTGRCVEKEVGTGHNAYVIDEDGAIWNTYHARLGAEGVRSSGIRRVHFDIDGEPRLDLIEEKDLKETYRDVTTDLIVKAE